MLRKYRRSRRSIESGKAEDRSGSTTRTSPGIPPREVYSLLGDEYRKIDYGLSDGGSPEATTSELQDTDTEQSFNWNWGYLPPLDEDALVVIEAIVSNPEMAKAFARISPDHVNFPEGLRNRNVLLEESQDIDPQSDSITLLAPGEPDETNGEKESHGQLWALDQAKCNKGSNEALFQRTIMMGLIARHRLIYARDPSTQCLLDFSVEEPWGCPPMPTRAYRKGESFLTQPKPDLAVCFDRKALIPDHLWNDMPRATKRLACYESADEIGGRRAFHFFTIEAKKAKTSIVDTVGMRQSLNNASQALHNMFEFFKEAGPYHEDTFFAKVRFFSVVASTEGIAIRIHRAERESTNESNQGFIIQGYPLRFEYKEFCNIPRDKFERTTVLETFEKILLGYGAKVLHPLLQTAAKDVVEKLRKDTNGMFLRGNEDFYRYGQTAIPLSKRTTPAVSRAQSFQNNVSFGSLPGGPPVGALNAAQSGTNISFEMSRTGMTTPGNDIGAIHTSVLNDGVKRRRENRMSARKVRQRNQSGEGF